MDYLVYIICGLLVLAGFVGTILPMLPGVPLVFLGVAVLAFFTKFAVISPWTLAVLLVLTLISLAIDYLSGIIGAKFSGASLWGMAGALAGALVGLVYFGILGLIFAPAVFVLVFEILAKKSVKKSAKSASYTLFSTIAGMVINGIIAVAMLVIFIVALIVK